MGLLWDMPDEVLRPARRAAETKKEEPAPRAALTTNLEVALLVKDADRLLDELRNMTAVMAEVRDRLGGLPAAAPVDAAVLKAALREGMDLTKVIEAIRAAAPPPAAAAQPAKASAWTMLVERDQKGRIDRIRAVPVEPDE